MRIINHPYQLSCYTKREDIRILPFKEKGKEYDNCFILLNPFYKLNIKKVNFKESKPKWIEGKKSQILKDYDVYLWAEFLNDSGIKDIKDIVHCLYVTDHNYVDRFQKVRRNIWERFNRNINENQLISNADSHLSILLINPILNGFKELGYDKIILYDIFDDKETIFDIDELIESESELPTEFRLTTNDRKILLYQEYEHYETFIYSTNKKLLDSFITYIELEGFFANQTTTLLWTEIEYGKGEEVIKIDSDRVSKKNSL